MTGDQVVKYYGDKNKAAAELGVEPQTVKRWTENEIPIWSQHAIAHISKDALKVDKGNKK